LVRERTPLLVLNPAGSDLDEDYPYDTIEEAQDWWKGIALPENQKQAIGRTNAIKLFRLPLEL
jgi:predicted TIM-barrel fold metal-dependent hydrolase